MEGGRGSSLFAYERREGPGGEVAGLNPKP